MGGMLRAIESGAVAREIEASSGRYLRAVASGATPLGKVMLQLRRRVLAEGFPIVLALSAAGDADWLIE